MKRTLQLVNAISTLIMIAMNALSGAGVFSDQNVGEISDKYDTVFAPAGITFSIWGVIFAWLAVFVVYQARDLFSKQKVDMPYIDQISWWLLVANIANGVWLIAWTNEQIVLSMVLMVVLLASLRAIYVRMKVGVVPVSNRDKWLVHVPFSIYLGWISVATIANFSVMLVFFGAEQFDSTAFVWAAIMVGVGALLGMAITILRADIAYGAVIIWALLGIFLKQTELNAPQAVWVRWAAIAGMGLVAAAVVTIIIRKVSTRTA